MAVQRLVILCPAPNGICNVERKRRNKSREKREGARVLIRGASPWYHRERLRRKAEPSKARFRGRREIGNDEEARVGAVAATRRGAVSKEESPSRSNGGPPRRRCTWQLPRKIDIPTNPVFPSSFPRLSLVFPYGILSLRGRATADFSYLDRAASTLTWDARELLPPSSPPLVASLFSPSAERAVGR